MGPEFFMGSGMWFMPFVFLAIMLVVVFLVFSRSGMRPPWLGQRGSGGGARADEPSPLEILKQRYAKGEITKEEFEQIKQDL